MFGLPSFRIGRILGIPVEVNASWLLIFALVGASLAFEAFPLLFPERETWLNVASGFVTAILFFASVVAHEASHSLVARAGGAGIRKITLFIFGGVAQMEEEPSSPGREFLMAAAGPGMSLAIALASAAAVIVGVFLKIADTWWAPLELLALMNLGLAVFNLLPGFPLDGGRVLRALLWWGTGDLLKATRWAAGAGQALGWLLAATGVYGAVAPSLGLPWGQRDAVSSLWLVVLGWFLASMASRAYQDQRLRAALATVPVESVMRAPAPVARADDTVAAVLGGRTFGPRIEAYALVTDREVVGILEGRALEEVPWDRQDEIRLRDIARMDLSRIVISTEDGLDVAVAKMPPDGPDALIVVGEGRLAGIVTRADVIRAVRR